jgi:hypothetical protein
MSRPYQSDLTGQKSSRHQLRYDRRFFESDTDSPTSTAPKTINMGGSQGKPRLATRCKLSTATTTAPIKNKIPIIRTKAGFTISPKARNVIGAHHF